MTAPVLRGAGLELRPWTLADWPGILQLADDPMSRRWSPSLQRVDTRADAEAWLQVRIAKDAYWAVVDPATGGLLARIGLHDLNEEDSCAEVGYGVLEAHRRKGIARRAVALVVDYGFGTRGLVRIWLEHAVGNVASCAVARVSGFTLEGIKRSGLRARGDAFDDAHLHARLASDPEPDPADAAPAPVEIAAGAYQLCIADPDLDAASVLAACADPMIKLFNAGPETLDDAYAWCRGRADWSSGTHASWLIKDTLGTLLGAVSLFDIDRRALAGQAGYWVAAQARGRGVAGAGLAAATRFGFGGLGLNRVQLFHAVENEASCRTALAAGYAVEGTHRQSYRYGDGLLRNEHSHGRLASD